MSGEGLARQCESVRWYSVWLREFLIQGEVETPRES
ncbi:hypothetical protein HRbin28_01865 [bacterium HR28]|nr:hypothetical protein HRbin28_01865 [bacterium HR28]